MRAGTYTELLDFNGKAITVFGESGAGATIIQGGGSGPVVRFDSGEPAKSVLSGFTIRAGAVPFGYGGGIYCAGSEPTLRGLIVQDNSAQWGGGLAVVTGSPRVEACTIFENTVTGSSGRQGANVYIGNADPHFIDCTIAGDSSGSSSGAFEGGGVFITGSSFYQVKIER